MSITIYQLAAETWRAASLRRELIQWVVHRRYLANDPRTWRLSQHPGVHRLLKMVCSKTGSPKIHHNCITLLAKSCNELWKRILDHAENPKDLWVFVTYGTECLSVSYPKPKAMKNILCILPNLTLLEPPLPEQPQIIEHQRSAIIHKRNEARLPSIVSKFLCR